MRRLAAAAVSVGRALGYGAAVAAILWSHNWPSRGTVLRWPHPLSAMADEYQRWLWLAALLGPLVYAFPRYRPPAVVMCVWIVEMVRWKL